MRIDSAVIAEQIRILKLIPPYLPVGIELHELSATHECELYVATGPPKDRLNALAGNIVLCT